MYFDRIRKQAFTLAEVLITLAIIGVVAALTIPSVIANYKNNVYVTQLKKEYNYITNAFRATMARDGVTRLSDTKLWSKIIYSGAFPQDLAENLEFKEEFLKTFNVVQIYGNANPVPDEKSKYRLLNGGTPWGSWGFMYTCVCLADGACFYFAFRKTPSVALCGYNTSCKTFKEFQQYYQTPTKLWQRVGEIYIDVNGFRKGPNQIGRDFFRFVIGNDGNIYPLYSADEAIGENISVSYSKVVSNTAYTYWKYKDNEECNPKYSSSYSGTGQACAARIMEEGWKMNY